MKEVIKKVLIRIEFSRTYSSICNNYLDIDNGRNFSKSEVQNLLKETNQNFNYTASDRSFYKDYLIANIKIRFSFKCKYGFIQCFYVITNGNTTNNVFGRFNSIAEIENPNFAHEVKHKFPIGTTLIELNSILSSLLELNKSFTLELKNHYNEINNIP